MTKKELKELKETKTLGTYKVNFKTRFDLENDDFIYLDVTMSEDLKELIKSICLLEEDTIPYERYTFVSQKYKVKSWLYNSLVNDDRDFLFDVGLLKDGTLSVKFNNTDYVMSVVRRFKEGAKGIIDNVLKFREYEVNVKYTVSEKNE